MSRRYSVMLVDDEEEVVKTIVRTIDWDALGFSMPVLAGNGLEALELAETTPPDVVMTDIQMPYMDGLTLSRRLKETWPNTKVIIFSGFDEFEYAKEAIRLQAEEYILKPVNSEELSRVFARIHEALEKEEDEQRNIKKLEHYYQDSLPLMQEGFYTSLIEGRGMVSEKEYERILSDLEISLDGPLYVVCVMHTSTTHVPEGMSPRLLALSVRRLAEERLREEWRVRFFSYLSNTVMIVEMDREEELTALVDSCDKFCRLAGSLTKAVVTIGVGAITKDPRDLSYSYSGARSAISYRVIYGTAKAISIQEIAPGELSFSRTDDEEQLKEVFKRVRLEDADQLREAVDAYMARTEEFSSVQEYQFFAMELVSEIYRFARNNKLDLAQVFQDSEDVYSLVVRLEKEDLRQWMCDTCLVMQAILAEQRLSNSQSFVSKAMDYVNENFADKELSVEKVCSHLGVSAAYFSTVFRKETGKPFTAFLTDVRMNRAVELLLGQNEKTYIIAEAVGYSDPNYFSYVFKKQFGVSPSKYRQGIRAG
ncbi:MAG: response regulator [Solobacterium sp.]|nr:response regulator [Solobacterium sp.]